MTQSYSAVPGGIGPSPKKMSTTMGILTACMLGVVIGLLGLNYWHTTALNSKSPEEMDLFIEGISRRLLQAESQTIKNGLVMEKLLNSLQSRLVKLEIAELEEITKHSQDEAVRLALILSAQPAPPMPEFELDPKYLNNDKLADAIDDVFSKAGDKDDYNEEERRKWEEFDDYDDKDKLKKEDASEVANTMTDAEATTLCSDWKTKYSVVQGVSWGNLPYDLQQKWIKTSCDYHLGHYADGTQVPTQSPSGQFHFI